MKDRLIRRFGELERVREQIAALVASVPAERARLQPSKGKWSAVQIVDHLVTAEKGTLGYIRKKIQAPEAIPPAGLTSAIKTFALVAMLSSPLKFRAPDVISDEPDNPVPGDALAKWAAARGELREMLETLPDDVMRRALFKHPAAGRMNMSQALDFMMAHQKRHGKQMKRLLAQV